MYNFERFREKTLITKKKKTSLHIAFLSIKLSNLFMVEWEIHLLDYVAELLIFVH